MLREGDHLSLRAIWGVLGQEAHFIELMIQLNLCHRSGVHRWIRICKQLIGYLASELPKWCQKEIGFGRGVKLVKLGA